MSFTLTTSHVESLATPAKSGDLMPWIAACDENVKWRIGASDQVGKGRSGVYDIAGWTEHLAPKIEICLGKNGLKVDTQSINVIGSKAILEGVVNGIQQKDGTPYQNKFAMVVAFSNDTGKIVSVNHYMDTEVEYALLNKHGV